MQNANRLHWGKVYYFLYIFGRLLQFLLKSGITEEQSKERNARGGVLPYTVLSYNGTGGHKVHLLATVNAAAFSTYYKKNIGVLKIAGIAVSQVAISALAGLCAVHIAVRLVLNVVFPFVWVCLHSSPFDKQGYFVGAMTFVFVQLMRITPGEVGYMVIVSCCTSALTAAAIIIIGADKKEPQARLFRNTQRTACGGGKAGKYARQACRGRPLFRRRKAVPSLLRRQLRSAPPSAEWRTHTAPLHCCFSARPNTFSDEALYKESAQVDELKLKLAAFLRKAEQQINLENNDALIAEPLQW